MWWNVVRKKLFFSDAPAQGAFYALTQLLLGSYLLFSSRSSFSCLESAGSP